MYRWHVVENEWRKRARDGRTSHHAAGCPDATEASGGLPRGLATPAPAPAPPLHPCVDPRCRCKTKPTWTPDLGGPVGPQEALRGPQRWPQSQMHCLGFRVQSVYGGSGEGTCLAECWLVARGPPDGPKTAVLGQAGAYTAHGTCPLDRGPQPVGRGPVPARSLSGTRPHSRM